jgi:methylenetetrahydrofolate--tRNA-(uracil-5-)-methyltransferase
MPKDIKVLGAGLAGSEAAWQIAKRGLPVRLYEMRPIQTTKAHTTANCAELVCSNSFRGAALNNAVGLLKEELKIWDSLIMEAALASEVPAGGALAVDRQLFSQYIDDKIRCHPLITFCCEEVTSIPHASKDSLLVIATGPLTSPSLAKSIEELVGSHCLAFFDAISPIVFDESLDHTLCFRQSRYDKGEGDDYLNIGFSEEQYKSFVAQIIKAEKYTGNEGVENDSLEKLRPFEGCMPIEDLVERGEDTLRFGPLKPTGLTDPRTGERPYAVMQLRQDDKLGKRWSLVGMQTRMKRFEQDKIFKSLAALRNAEFVRYGSVHRNTFIDSPKILNATLEMRTRPGLFFAGQLTGTEGYVESTAGGLIAGINAFRRVKGQSLLTCPDNTALGSLLAYISDPQRVNFQPMNISFGLMPSYLSKSKNNKGKKARRLETAKEALEQTRNYLAQI